MLALDPHDIHLWYVPVKPEDNLEGLTAYQKLMNEQERAKNSRYVFEKDRKLHLLTRALIRTTLSKYLPDIAPQDWLFAENQYGKPNVANAKLAFPIQFNVSHTDGMIVMAVMLDQEVGVDIESLARPIASKDLAKSVFSAREYQALNALAAEDFSKRFFQLWTLKEAYIKARGKGLSIPLDSFSFSFSAAGESAISFEAGSDDCDPDKWVFKQLTLMEHYLVAVGTKGGDVNAGYGLIVREGLV